MITHKQTNKQYKSHSGAFLACLLAGIVLSLLLACEEAGGSGSCVISGTDGNGDGNGDENGNGNGDSTVSFEIFNLFALKNSYFNTIAKGSKVVNEIDISPMPLPNFGNAITYELSGADVDYFKYDEATGKLYYIGTDIRNATKNEYRVELKITVNKEIPETKIIHFTQTVVDSDITRDEYLQKVEFTPNTLTMADLMLHLEGMNKYKKLSDFHGALANISSSATLEDRLKKLAEVNADMEGQFAYGNNLERLPNLTVLDTSKTTDMSGMFSSAGSSYTTENPNWDIGGWDTSNVRDMSYMFPSCSKFDWDIGNWNTGNVTNMYRMFQAASIFNQDISKWDVSSVQNMESMFQAARKFNQDISKWDVSSVRNMESMFKYAFDFNKNLADWNIASLTTAKHMFYTSHSSITSHFSQENLDLTLHGWAQINKVAGEVIIAKNVDFRGQEQTTTHATAFYKLQLAYNWDMRNFGSEKGLTVDTSVTTGSIAGDNWDHNDTKSFATESSGVVYHALAGDDNITGSDFDDIIAPGEGNDTITTNKGSDTIVLYYVEDGHNTIADFTIEDIGNGKDTIDAHLLFMTLIGETLDFARMDAETRKGYIDVEEDSGKVRLIFKASGGGIVRDWKSLSQGSFYLNEELVTVKLITIDYSKVKEAGGNNEFINKLINDGNLILDKKILASGM